MPRQRLEQHFEKAGGDECDWFRAETSRAGIMPSSLQHEDLPRYWINIVVDCTLGVAVSYALLQLSMRCAFLFGRVAVCFCCASRLFQDNSGLGPGAGRALTCRTVPEMGFHLEAPDFKPGEYRVNGGIDAASPGRWQSSSQVKCNSSLN